MPLLRVSAGTEKHRALKDPGRVERQCARPGIPPLSSGSLRSGGACWDTAPRRTHDHNHSVRADLQSSAAWMKCVGLNLHAQRRYPCNASFPRCEPSPAPFSRFNPSVAYRNSRLIRWWDRVPEHECALNLNRTRLSFFPPGEKWVPGRSSLNPNLAESLHYGTIQDFQNHLACAPMRKTPNASAEDGVEAARISWIGNLSYKAGKKLVWNSENDVVL